jgi:transposase
LESAESLWNFFEKKGVPPTNIHDERQLRPLIISKKLSFGTQSKPGSRFIERIFSLSLVADNKIKIFYLYFLKLVLWILWVISFGI